MKVHPRNEGTSTLDMILLFGMAGVFFALGGAIWYLASVTTMAINSGG